jgi:protein gp37
VSGIERTGSTWNPITGCDRISPGCQNCYALSMAGRLKRMGSAKYHTDGDPRTSGPGSGVAVHPSVLDRPLHWWAPGGCSLTACRVHARVPTTVIARGNHGRGQQAHLPGAVVDGV